MKRRDLSPSWRAAVRVLMPQYGIRQCGACPSLFRAGGEVVAHQARQFLVRGRGLGSAVIVWGDRRVVGLVSHPLRLQGATL